MRGGAIDLQPLHRRNHRDGRRQHRIGVKQPRGQQAAGGQPRQPLGLAQLAVDQRQQRQTAALAMVVAAHYHENIFDRHHHDHCPEDQADNAVDVEDVDGQRMLAGHDRLNGIEGAGADVAEHNARGAQHQRGQRAADMVGTYIVTLRRTCACVRNRGALSHI